MTWKKCLFKMKDQITTSNKQYHQLDPGYGGYASCEVYSYTGQLITVLTTPISTAGSLEHYRLLDQKIVSLW